MSDALPGSEILTQAVEKAGNAAAFGRLMGYDNAGVARLRRALRGDVDSIAYDLVRDAEKVLGTPEMRRDSPEAPTLGRQSNIPLPEADDPPEEHVQLGPALFKMRLPNGATWRLCFAQVMTGEAVELDTASDFPLVNRRAA